MKFPHIIRILLDNGFALDRQRGTSHRQYEGKIGGQRHLVTVAGHDNDDVRPKTLKAIIRQSGLPKDLFR